MAGYLSTEDRVIAELARMAASLEAIRELLLRVLPAPAEEEPPADEEAAP